MTKWLEHVKATFKSMKKADPNTALKDALKRASKTYKKGSASKTHKGDKDFTTKKGSKDFHVGHHDVKPRKPFTKKKRGGNKDKPHEMTDNEAADFFEGDDDDDDFPRTHANLRKGGRRTRRKGGKKQRKTHRKGGKKQRKTRRKGGRRK